MTKDTFLLLAATLALSGCLIGPEVEREEKDDYGALYPFPQAKTFNGTIKPSNRTQIRLNGDIEEKYREYKNKYLAKTDKGRRYIKATGTNESAAAATISEAHGYGMIIFALMAGHDKDAKTIFDGMNTFRKAHRSRINNDLMSWTVFTEDLDAEAGMAKNQNTSATDGDLDISYALLLAYKQWGDAKYLSEARTLIDAIKKSNIHGACMRTALGDWNTWNWGSSSVVTDRNTSRSSDWMMGHFRAFAAATNDNFWLEVADTAYSVLRQVSNQNTGLVSCFINGIPPRPDPNAGGTGEQNGQHYWSNACRVPWRLATDYAHYSTPEAKEQIDKISAWLRSSTRENTGSIKQGYQLDGTPISNNSASPMYTAPFAAGMIANTNNQTFLNDLYASVRQTNAGEAYNAAIQLLCMLLISGNWWPPY